MSLFLVFIALVVGILAGMAWLSYLYLLACMPGAQAIAPVLKVAFALSPFLFVIANIALRTKAHWFFEMLYQVGAQCMQVLWILFVVTAVHAVVYMGSKALFDERIAQYMGTPLYCALFLVGLVIYVLSIYNGMHLVRVEKHIPAEGVQTRIAFIADTHIGPVWKAKDLASTLQAIRSEKPDALLIAGDFFDGPATDYAALVPLLKETSAQIPIYFAAGNHEGYGDTAAFRETLQQGGVQILDDESRLLKSGVRVVGFQYGRAGERVGQSVTQARVQAALASSSATSTFTISLKHTPDDASLLQKYLKPNLMLFGHTHGGQQFPGTMVARARYAEYTYGLIKTATGFSYTTSGAGSWGPFNRLGTQREYVLFTIGGK
jgi:uncharacterized protein